MDRNESDSHFALHFVTQSSFSKPAWVHKIRKVTPEIVEGQAIHNEFA